MTQWSFGKTQRKVDKKLLAEVRQRPCVICNSKDNVDAAHIQSRGSGGPDEEFNLLSFCRAHHCIQHQLGFLKLIEKYPKLAKELDLKGWHIKSGKLRRK